MGRKRQSGIAAFFDGFNEGYNTVGKVLQDADLRNIANATVQTDTGFTPQQGADLEAAAASGQYDVNYDQAKGGYTVTPKAGGETGVVSPGQRYSFMGALQDKEFTQPQQDRMRMAGMADVLAKHGDPVRAMQLRQMANQSDMQEVQKRAAEQQIDLAGKQEERAQAAHQMGMQRDQLSLDKAKEEAARTERIKAFHTAVLDLRKQGQNPNIQQMRNIAADNGLDDGDLFTIATQFTGLNKAQTEEESASRLRGFDDAFQKGGLDGVRKLYDDSALFDNGRKMEIKRDKKSGTVTILDGGNPIFTGKGDTEAAAFMRRQLTDPVGAVSFAYEVQKYQSGLKKDAADIRHSDAAAGASRASSEQTQAETDYMKAHGAKMGTTSGKEDAVKVTPDQLGGAYLAQPGGRVDRVDSKGMVSTILNPKTPNSPSAGTSGPSVGEVRVINGQKARWDGKGWLLAQ